MNKKQAIKHVPKVMRKLKAHNENMIKLAQELRANRERVKINADKPKKPEGGS